MRIITMLLVLIWVTTSVSLAQHNIVKGQIIDTDGEPIPLAHIMLISQDSVMSGVPADFEGNFILHNIEKGSYSIVINSIGYEEYTQIISHQGSRTNLGEISLTSSSMELDEVVIVGETDLYERRSNSVVIDITQQASAGASALDILSTTGGLSINKQNGSISIPGKGKAAIMINGKLSQIDGQALIGLLSGLPTSEIKKLEVYNNPPSKYEANGTGGVINIITTSNDMKKNGGSFSLISGYGQGEKVGASSNFHINNQKLSVNGTYSFNRNRSPEEWTLDNVFNQHVVAAESMRKPVTISHNYMMEADYSIFGNTTIGGSFSGYYRNWDMLADDKVISDNADGIAENIDILTSEINKWNHLSGNAHLNQSIGSNHHLIINYNYLRFDNSNPSSYVANANNTSITKKTPINFNVYKFDYDGKISETLKIEAGVKATVSHFKNAIVVKSSEENQLFPADNLSSFSEMNETIIAAYSSFQFQLNNSTSLATGIRYEHTDNKLQTSDSINTINRKYGNFFPNISLNHQLNDSQYLQVNYNRRINRPTFNHLGSFVIFLGPSALFSGNTSLNPAIVSKYSLEWGWNNKFINLEYLNEHDAITEFQPKYSSNANQYIFKAENFDERKALILTLGLPFKLTKWWKSDNSIILQDERLKTSFENATIQRNKRSIRITTSQQFSIFENTTIQLSGYHQSSTLFGISTFKPMSALNVGLQHQFKKNLGTFKLSYNNVLASENWKIKTKNLLLSVDAYETYLPESRVLTLTYTKTLGSNSTKKSYGHNAEEEKGRVK